MGWDEGAFIFRVYGRVGVDRVSKKGKSWKLELVWRGRDWSWCGETSLAGAYEVLMGRVANSVALIYVIVTFQIPASNFSSL